MLQKKIMYYIWFDESDKEGAYYSNFYGGILVDSKNYENVLAMSKTFVEEFGITEEIKWQKVNEYWYEKYLTLVDFIFDLLAQGYIKIRIFFRNNQYTASYLTREQRIRLILCYTINLSSMLLVSNILILRTNLST